MVFYFLAFLIGLAVGSSLNVIITRLPRGEPFWTIRSRCLHCHTPLPWFNILPLVSFIWLRGRCRFCQQFIPWRYPAVELAGGLLALGLWAKFPHSPVLFTYAPFTAALIVLTVLDLQYGWLPDAITLPGIGLGLGLSLILPYHTFLEALAGALLGALLFQIIRKSYEFFSRWRHDGSQQGMGGGDVKLLALIGAFLGIKSLPLVIFISAALGTMGGLLSLLATGQWRKGIWRTTAIPFGPFLSVGALAYLFWGEDLMRFLSGWE